MKPYHIVVPVGNMRRKVHAVGTGIFLFLLITLSLWRTRSSRNESTLRSMKNGWSEPNSTAQYNQKEDKWIPPKDYDPVDHNWEVFPEFVTSHGNDRHDA